MKSLSLAALAAGGLVLASCATNPPVVYGPGPQGTDLPVPAAPVSEGMIAACGHPGAKEAQVVYPDGWQVRLAEVAEKGRSNDELMGGPVTSEVVDRDAQPVQRPVPSHPASAATRGREAQCYAMFDVNTEGRPEEVLTACSSPEFSASTFEAIQQVRFSPRTVDGRAVRRLNVVYPITYCLDG